MKKMFYLFLMFAFTKSFGQSECKICDSLQYLQRQTGNRQAFDKYNSICLKTDSLVSEKKIVVRTKAICSDYISFYTYNSDSKTPVSGFRIEKNDTIFYKADIIPIYQKGEAEMMKFIKKHITYPKRCSYKNIQGKVYISFVVDENGNIYDVYALISPDPDLAYEAIRVIKLLHPWIPGKISGRPIKYQYNLPIKFTL